MKASLLRVERESADRFAAATSSEWDGSAGTPYLYGVTPIRDVLLETLLAAMPEGIREQNPVLHGEHLVRYHRPVHVGSLVQVRGRHLATVPKPRGTAVIIEIELQTEDGLPIETHELTSFLPDLALEEIPGTWTSVAPQAFDPSLPVIEAVIPTDGEQSRRYAIASGDTTLLHTSDEVARGHGYPGVIMHGLCTLAISMNSIAPLLDGPPQLLAVRFSAPGFPGQPIHLRMQQQSANTVIFESRTPSGQPTMTRGLLSSTGR